MHSDWPGVSLPRQEEKLSWACHNDWPRFYIVSQESPEIYIAVGLDSLWARVCCRPDSPQSFTNRDRSHGYVPWQVQMQTGIPRDLESTVLDSQKLISIPLKGSRTPCFKSLRLSMIRCKTEVVVHIYLLYHSPYSSHEILCNAA